jgi:CBS domain-containing protein
MKANELMTPTPTCASTQDTARHVARLMRDCDCGAIPVVDEKKRVVGMITDRDLAIRALADGKDGDTKVADLMSPSPCCASIDDNVRDIERLMSDNQVRRIPIVDASGSVVGIVSQADLARAADRDSLTEREVALVVEAISEPAPHVLSRSRDGSSGTEQRF